jgi:hypothetical protein
MKAQEGNSYALLYYFIDELSFVYHSLCRQQKDYMSILLCFVAPMITGLVNFCMYRANLSNFPLRFMNNYFETFERSIADKVYGLSNFVFTNPFIGLSKFEMIRSLP